MKAEEVYAELASRIGQFIDNEMSIENWTAVCSLMAKGAKVAAIAKEADISVIPFYRMGLKYLRQAPKEMSIEQALETLDDSDEFYSFDEQLVAVRAFSQFANRLEEWAEALDLHHGVFWRIRETTKPWAKANLEECEESDWPPYYGWVLVNLNKIKNHFDPPLEPYATELNNNPYTDQLFAYQSTCQQWRYVPKIVETLFSQLSSVQDENPLIGKYLAWGAPSVAEIPTELLHGHEGQVSKALFDLNLSVRDEDYKGLFARLNGNADAFLKQHEDDVRVTFEEFANGSLYGKTPLEFLTEKLDEVQKGIGEYWLPDDASWRGVLAKILKLPRYTIHYFDWARTSADEGPDEPGLVYTLKDGTKQQVHYHISQSKWWQPVDQIELKIHEIIVTCKNLAIEIDAEAILNQWQDIETAWKKCVAKSCPCHCNGDVAGFANAFCDGLLKISVLLPNIKRASGNNSVHKKDQAIEDRYAAVDKVMAVYAKMRPSVTRFQFLCNSVKDGMSVACGGDPDFSVWETNWLTAAMQLLAEDPCQGSCTIIDRQNLFNSITIAFEKIVALFSLLQNADPEAVVDEYDCFFQDVNDVMAKNWRRHPVSGEKGVVLTPDFVTRVGIHGDWVFNDLFIRQLGSHCSAKNAIDHYRNAKVSETDQQTIDAVNKGRDDSACGSFAEHLLFQHAIDDAEKLVGELESSDDEAVKVLVSDENVLGAVFQPFFGTYYTPYTRYPDKVEKDKELGLDIPACIKQLSDLIERIFARVEKLPISRAGCRSARKSWKTISTLYAFRMKNPYVRLSCKKQEEYGELFQRLIKDLCSSLQESNDPEESDVKASSSLVEDSLLMSIATKPAAETVDELKAAIEAVGKATNDGLKKVEKQISELGRVEKATLNWVSDGTQGKPLEDGRCLQGIREKMVNDGFLCVRDEGMTNLSEVARTLIKKYARKSGGYTENETDTFRRAIARRCEDEGIDVKAMQGKK